MMVATMSNGMPSHEIGLIFTVFREAIGRQQPEGLNPWSIYPLIYSGTRFCLHFIRFVHHPFPLAVR